MATINLLPWRDKYREEKKKEFIVIMLGVAVIAGLVAFVWISHVNGKVDHQRQRNQMLEQEISQLDKKVKEIEDLQTRREELLELMRLIRDLEGTRSVIVHQFDDLVRALPDGVFLTELSRVGSIVSISGIAESNNRVSSFMRNLAASDWYDEPNLSSVEVAPEEGGQANSFEMTVKAVLSPELRKAAEEEAN
ncbi:PilN domain-containing protein [Gilvimarinus sp. SDUM040013]|uniref:PilN domain-containing protein n=1 Tax=Gilvimarinus gilvus TaxID=3058038 RepID=A0ABU4S0C2_9GAMM|nr:PilN domain-containing protein [Gilvimarinus sp. SDUM040013]MDO3387389.1 PilN domain-containing protein [Gilvimarinus sp. SDUM040013]MDX6849866.1 PilN domain-containing protein [Gilvimarinus sp. SDUM040013]